MTETASNIEEPRDLNAQIAARLQELRAASGLSLDALAARSGVSRSMISVIERGQANPTAVVLDKLASALGVELATLFETGSDNQQPAKQSLQRRSEQHKWCDPESGYVRRNLSPPGSSRLLQLIRVNFPAGASVAFDSHTQPQHRQIWMLAGKMEISDGETRHSLEKGDCLALLHDTPLHFHNPGLKTARYLIAICPLPAGAP